MPEKTTVIALPIGADSPKYLRATCSVSTMLDGLAKAPAKSPATSGISNSLGKSASTRPSFSLTPTPPCSTVALNELSREPTEPGRSFSTADQKAIGLFWLGMPLVVSPSRVSTR